MSITSVPTLSDSDADLATRFAREAEPLFDVLMRGARRLTRSNADAEDLLQDTLLHAYTGFRTFQAGQQHQGVALPDPLQPVGQHVPLQTAAAHWKS